MYIYFKDCSLVKSHKLSGLIERHCLSLEFVGGLGESGGAVFQEKFAKYIMAIDEHLNSEPIG